MMYVIKNAEGWYFYGMRSSGGRVVPKFQPMDEGSVMAYLFSSKAAVDQTIIDLGKVSQEVYEVVPLKEVTGK